VIRTVIGVGIRLITGIIRVGLALIRGDWSGAWNAMKALASAAIHGVVAIIRAAVGLAGAAARLVGTAIHRGIIQPLDHLVSELLSAIRGAVSSAIHTVAGWAVGAAAAIGARSRPGSCTGSATLPADLASKLKDAAGGALGAVKGALHIGSPSRVFADEVGAPIAQGIIAGFLRDIAPLADTMTGSLTPALSSGRLTTPGLASSAAPGYGAARARRRRPDLQHPRHVAGHDRTWGRAGASPRSSVTRPARRRSRWSHDDGPPRPV
jgi:phage-related protein